QCGWRAGGGALRYHRDVSRITILDMANRASASVPPKLGFTLLAQEDREALAPWSHEPRARAGARPTEMIRCAFGGCRYSSSSSGGRKAKGRSASWIRVDEIHRVSAATTGAISRGSSSCRSLKWIDPSYVASTAQR